MAYKLAEVEGEVKYGFIGMKNENGTWKHHDEIDHVTISRGMDEIRKSNTIVVDSTETREKGKLEAVKNIKMNFDEKSGRLLSASFYKVAPAEGSDKRLTVESGMNLKDKEKQLEEFFKKVEDGKEAVYQGLKMEKNAGGWYAKDAENREIKIEKGRDYTRIDTAMNGQGGWTDETVIFDKGGKATHYKFSSRKIGVLAEFDIQEEEKRIREFRTRTGCYRKRGGIDVQRVHSI